jgi:hypothetical protein
MEPRETDLKPIPQPRLEGQPRPDEKKRRFRIVKLEERIAPSKGGNGTNNGCGVSARCSGLSCGFGGGWNCG